MKPRPICLAIATFLMCSCALSQWVQTNGPNRGMVKCFQSVGENILAGTWGGGVFLSADSGGVWTEANFGLTYTDVRSFAVLGENLFAGTIAGVFLSTDNGASWAQTGFQSSVNALAVSGPNLFAATGSWSLGGKIHRTSDNGATWTEADDGLNNTTIQSFAVIGGNLFAGGSSVAGGGVFRSTDGGASWAAVDAGLTDRDVMALGSGGAHLYAGTVAGGIWRRSLPEIVTSVAPLRGDMPREFLLSQNYPNPFNPTTIITYQLPRSSAVRLSVYDMLGGEVSVLVNDAVESGIHEVKFDGSALASGVYMYRLQAGGSVRVRKFILLR